MNVLVVNQSVIDTMASFFTMLSAVVEVDGTRMSNRNTFDQFVCRLWLTRLPFWVFLLTSTYNMLLMALERYAAVIYPIPRSQAERFARKNVREMIETIRSVSSETYNLDAVIYPNWYSSNVRPAILHLASDVL